MVLYYLDLTSAFVIPLLTIYLMGSFTRVHRSSGLIGLLAAPPTASCVWRPPWWRNRRDGFCCRRR